ncbi:hypothetical protein Tco_0883007 [Tanacetum coccineum]
MSQTRSTRGQENFAQPHLVCTNDDLLTEIYIRLPILCIHLFTTVSKQWLQILTSPDFIDRRRKIPNLDPPADHSFGSAEEVDHVRILQSCNGLLLCTGSAWPVFYYVYNPSTNLFKRLPQPNYSHDDSCFYSSCVFRMAFDPRKSLYYKVVQARRASEGLNRQLKHCKLNIEDHDHPIMTSLEIPHGLHRGRNFLESFGGPSNDPILLLMEIPHMLHLEGKFLESYGCLLLVCRDDIGSTEFTIYEMMKGFFVWSVGYLLNTEQLMNPLSEGWSIRTSVWSICFEEGEEDAFVVINLSEKVVKYNLISKTNNEIFDIRSNQTDDDDDVDFIPPFSVDPNLYEFISSLTSV